MRMYRQYPERFSGDWYVGAAEFSGLPVSDVRARSGAMNDSKGWSTDGQCGYRIVTCRAAARSVCRAARRALPTGLQVGVRRLGAPDAEEKRAP